MTNDPSRWNPLPHGPLERLAPSVYRLEGSLPNMPLRRVMTVIRRSDGSLLVHSPIATEPSTRDAIEALGPIRAIVVPSENHRLDAPAYAARYPDAKVYAPRGGREKIESRVRVDATLDALEADAHLRVVPIGGIRDREAALVVFDADDTTLVLNDVVFDMPHLTGGLGFVLKHITRSTGGPRITRLFRAAMLDDAAALRASLLALAELPSLRRIVVSHHRVITDDPASALRAAASAL